MDSPPLLCAPRKRLEDRFARSPDVDHFLRQRTGVHCLELERESGQAIKPAIWIGKGDIGAYRSRTERIRPTRVFSFCDTPLAIGKTAIFNAGEYLELDYSFSETSRFNEFRNQELVADWQTERVAIRMPSDSITISGDCALITQQADHVWGHWLVDVLPRLEIMRRLMPGITFAFSNHLPCSEELLERTGLRPNRMIAYDPYLTVLHADRIFVPSFVRFGNAFARMSRSIFTAISPHQRIRSNRIYVSRSRLAEGSTILNNLEIEALFIRRGFDVVHPQTMSIDEQIRAFARASHVAGEYGSGLHSTIFSAPGTAVLCLQSQRMRQYVQAGLGQVMGQPTGFIFGEPRTGPAAAGQKSSAYRDRFCEIDPVLAELAIEQLLSL